MLATFADQFRNTPAREEMEHARKLAADAGGDPREARWQGQDLSKLEPEQMEALLGDTVLKEFKVRLGRIGLEYQSPDRP
jgi:hypothetical protein